MFPHSWQWRVILAVAYCASRTASGFGISTPHGIRLTRTELAAAEERKAEDQLKGANFLELELASHKPSLGCTVEESLAPGAYVFVSKVVPEGNADMAGVKVGDVVVGATGLFGELEDVCGLGIEKVRGLVAARPDDEPFVLRIVRGTNVLEKHEQALVELCSDPTLDGKESEECIVSFLRDGYSLDTNGEVPVESDVDQVETEAEVDLVANMYDMWNEDIGLNTPQTNSDDSEEERPQPAAKPWSSRSSPSGTYVRDPKTGAMRNIG